MVSIKPEVSLKSEARQIPIKSAWKEPAWAQPVYDMPKVWIFQNQKGIIRLWLERDLLMNFRVRDRLSFSLLSLWSYDGYTYFLLDMNDRASKGYLALWNWTVALNVSFQVVKNKDKTTFSISSP